MAFPASTLACQATGSGVKKKKAKLGVPASVENDKIVPKSKTQKAKVSSGSLK
jgi:hypothetical protein